MPAVEQNPEELRYWVQRVHRMSDYRVEALDFLRRAGSTLPTTESDLALICGLWAVADEHDVAICDALTSFDSALFQVSGDLDITRGVEVEPTPGEVDSLIYQCSWSINRPETLGTSVVLAAHQASGRLTLEVRDADAHRRQVGFPIDGRSELYEALAQSFFTLHDMAASVRLVGR